MKSSLLKRIMKKEKKDVVHTSAYAEAQNGGGIGTASTLSFTDRMKIKGNRQRIREYSDSRIVTQARAEARKKPQSSGMIEKIDSFLKKDRQSGSAKVGKRLDNKPLVVPQSSMTSRPPAVKRPGFSKKI